jgi:hypothetical protein
MRKPTVAIERAMLASLEYAVRYPKKNWHDIGNDKTDRSAIGLLAKRGVIEVNHVTNQYRILK